MSEQMRMLAMNNPAIARMLDEQERQKQYQQRVAPTNYGGGAMGNFLTAASGAQKSLGEGAQAVAGNLMGQEKPKGALEQRAETQQAKETTEQAQSKSVNNLYMLGMNTRDPKKLEAIIARLATSGSTMASEAVSKLKQHQLEVYKASTTNAPKFVAGDIQEIKKNVDGVEKIVTMRFDGKDWNEIADAARFKGADASGYKNGDTRDFTQGDQIVTQEYLNGKWVKLGEGGKFQASDNTGDTREILQGANIVTQQKNKDGTWTQISTAPRWQAENGLVSAEKRQGTLTEILEDNNVILTPQQKADFLSTGDVTALAKQIPLAAEAKSVIPMKERGKVLTDVKSLNLKLGEGAASEFMKTGDYSSLAKNFAETPAVIGRMKENVDDFAATLEDDEAKAFQQARLALSASDLPELERLQEEAKLLTGMLADREEAKLSQMTEGYKNASLVMNETISRLEGGYDKLGKSGRAMYYLADATTNLFLFPSTESRAIYNDISNLKSNAFLAELQKLKAMSTNGSSGLGAVTQKEIEALERRITALDPTDKNFEGQVQTFKQQYDLILRKAYGLELDSDVPMQQPIPKGADISPAQQDAFNRARAMKQYEGYSDEQIMNQIRNRK